MTSASFHINKSSLLTSIPIIKDPHPIISHLCPASNRHLPWKPPVREPSLDGRRTRRTRRTRRLGLHQAPVGPTRGVALQDLDQLVLAGQELAWNLWPRGPMASQENRWRIELMADVSWSFSKKLNWWPLVASEFH